MKDVLNSFELRMLRRAGYLRERNIFGESHVYSYGTLPVFHIGQEIGWADSLLSLAFATRWNPKHLSYVRIRFFVIPPRSSAAESRLYEMSKATDK